MYRCSYESGVSRNCSDVCSSHGCAVLLLSFVDLPRRPYSPYCLLNDRVMSCTGYLLAQNFGTQLSPAEVCCPRTLYQTLALPGSASRRCQPATCVRAVQCG